MKSFLPIETERLLLRPISLGDLSDTLEHRTDPKVCRYIANPMTTEEVIYFISKHSKAWDSESNERLCVAIEFKKSRKVIGELMFRYLESSKNLGEIGFRLNQAFHKMGLAREATSNFMEALFENTLIHKLVAYCAAENVDSFRLMERLGMAREGALREQMLLDGVWTDQLIYGITREEWAQVRSTVYKSSRM